MQILDMQDGLRQYSGPGHWNDPDMMQIGNGMPLNEQRAHFTMWAMINAPLMAGNDLRNIPAETLNVLTNKEVIALNQDMLGIQAFRYAVNDSVETWLKPLQNDEWAIVYLNRSTTPKTVTQDWKVFSVTDELSGKMVDTTGKELYLFRDLWAKKIIADTKKALTVTLPGHDVLALRVAKKPVRSRK
jgi:alpha-galactosidase